MKKSYDSKFKSRVALEALQCNPTLADIAGKLFTSAEFIAEPRVGVRHYTNFYNAQRIHSVLGYQTPDELYFGACNSVNSGYSRSRRFIPIF